MPTLNNSLRHIGVLGKFSLSRPDNRRVVIPNEMNREVAFKAIGFELVYGRKTTVINGKFMGTFGISAPASALPEWNKTISLADAKPLIAAFEKGGDARQIGGSLFKDLLDHLDGLRPYWNPKFDQALTLAALYWSQAQLEGQPGVTGDVLREALFAPEINRPLLAWMRDPSPPPMEDRLKSLQEIFGKRPELKPISKELADGMGKMLTTFAGRMSLDAIRAKDVNGEIQACLLPDQSIDDLFRDYTGHANEVYRLVCCEPLLAFIIVWFFGKVAGKETTEQGIAPKLHAQLYAGKTGIAILPAEKRKEDQQTYEQEKEELARQFAESHAGEEGRSLIKFYQALSRRGTLKTELARNPKQEYTADDLKKAALERFDRLKAWGIKEGHDIFLEMSRLIEEIREGYRPFEDLYGNEALTYDTLAGTAKEAKGSAHKLWGTVLAGLNRDLKGVELADAFRAAYNKGWATVEDAALSAGIDQRKDAIIRQFTRAREHYARSLDTISPGMTLVVAGSIVGIPDPKLEQKQVSAPKTQGQSAAATLTQTVSVASVEKPKASAEVSSPQEPAGSATPPSSTDAEQEARSRQAYEDLIGGYSPEQLRAQPDRAAAIQEVVSDRADFDNLRTNIVNALAEKGATLAPERGNLRALLFAEMLLGAKPEMSPLGQYDTSLSVPILLEMVTAIGAVPGWESPDKRQLMAQPGEQLDCGVKGVALHEIYPLPKDADLAKAELTERVKYWQDLAFSLMDAKDYLVEVTQVQRLIEMHKGKKGSRITVFNETLADHVSDQATGSLACVSKYDSRNPNNCEEPPAYLWLTKEAHAHHDGALAKLNSDTDTVIAGIVQAGKKSTFCASYPIYFVNPPPPDAKNVPSLLVATLSSSVDGAPWDPVDLLCYLSGMELVELMELKKDVTPKIQKLFGVTLLSSTQKDSYYAALAPLLVGSHLLESRILTAGMFDRLEGGAPIPGPVVQAAVSCQPRAELVTAGYRQNGVAFDSIDQVNLQNIQWQAANKIYPLNKLQRIWPTI
ncbi:hypothetical protein [Pedosphaera parvula]|uniref:Uncharacterized protein n=1 Tax=Pedosphaera parvula (strain Ellin514) TaxID=320771 RepID=B9XAF7_PEDPL|nr:hypothetical protein [Pedosphaera parvula]EEF62992.1 hypothetical protein Cflav_PD5627 [Pedosphaera parvula Ellin514]